MKLFSWILFCCLLCAELELRVVNVTALALESKEEDGEEEEEIKYSAEDSDTTFSIPLQTLSHLSKGQFPWSAR